MGVIFFLFVVSIFSKEITDWPGYSGGKLPFKSYGDYIDIEGTKRSYYYMMHESYDESSNNVIMWSNGGPGCASLEGFATENGIFKLQTDSKTLVLDEYSWNKLGDMIYIDTPAGVGFSTDFGSEHIIWDDDKYADDVYKVLLGVFAEFPELQKKDFWITGESYAGFYIPALVERIHAGNIENKRNGGVILPLKGFNIGNGCMDRKEDVNSVPDFLLQHLIITQPVYDDVMKKCKSDPWDNMNSTDCSDAYDAAYDMLFDANINPYFLYDECPVEPMERDYFFINGLPNYNNEENVDDDSICTGMKEVTAFYNQMDVKVAINANTSVKWDVCNFKINQEWNWKYDTMVPKYQRILQHYRGMFYSGDTDGIVNGVGSLRGISKVGLKVKKEWRSFMDPDNKRNAGFVVNYEGFTFVTIRGAGHMCPQVKPQRSFTVMKKFLEDDCC